MNHHANCRRRFLKAACSSAALSALTGAWPGPMPRCLHATQANAGDANLRPRRAQICITFDLEMSRNFPTWESTHWDYEKGNLDEAAKRYSLEAARRVKAAGGVIHFFVVGSVLEQADVQWLADLRDAGHPIGNHTYDHVNVTATSPKDTQFRFQRSPWLVGDKNAFQIVRDNIRLCSDAIQSRLGIERPAGFRTPGGFANGLADHSTIRKELLDQGFPWVSSLYPAHPNSQPGEQPSKEIVAEIAKANDRAQPFRYGDGLIEVPMSPISDIGAFRNGRWKLEWFLEAISASIERTIDRQNVFDFLAHPSCLGVVDPNFQTIDLICDLVKRAGDKAEWSDLQQIAARVP